jgi:hypothetical protein
MPFHQRQWNVVEVGPSQLAHRLVAHSWCMCVGFLCEGVLWLNDSTSPDGAQEWAVVRASDHQQLESITVGWATPEDDKKQVAEIQARFANGRGKPAWGRDYKLEPGALEHGEVCHHCA